MREAVQWASVSVSLTPRRARSSRPHRPRCGFDDILDTEKQLAFRVFENMGIALTPAERAAVDERPTKNIAAFIAYGRAVRYETDFRFLNAVTEYREALRLDPTFALAEARLEEIAPLAGLGSRRNALARATDFTVDRVNGLFTSPLGGAQPPGGITDPAFPALTDHDLHHHHHSTLRRTCAFSKLPSYAFALASP